MNHVLVRRRKFIGESRIQSGNYIFVSFHILLLSGVFPGPGLL
jgi:hypothetical protein